MNAIVEARNMTVARPSEDDVISVLQNSLYPGAKPESIRLVLAWCRATGRDPMKKPVHLVPTSVKVAKDKWELRDVLMLGIGTYRTDAARTGEYAGKTAPEYGPLKTVTFGSGNEQVKVTFPEWCEITVFRLVKGTRRGFPAKEYWLENYATAGRNTDVPNAMWRKRAYGQLAKVSEAQALRMAFPEETGNTYTSEEMDGKTFEGLTIDAGNEREPAPAVAKGTVVSIVSATPPDGANKRTWRAVLDELQAKLDACATMDEVVEVRDLPAVRSGLENASERVKNELTAMLSVAYARVSAEQDAAPQDMPEVTDGDVPQDALGDDDDFPGDRP